MIEWGMGRADELKYAAERNIPIATANKKYSTDENLWGRSCECDIIEHPEEIPPADSLEWIPSYENWPNEPEIVKITFKQGKPVAVNDKEMDMVELIAEVHKIAVKHGIGWVEQMEDRTIGLKSRETYEVPAASIIIPAHKELEKYVCNRHENSFKPMIDQKWTEMAYLGLWGDPLLDSLNAFINEVNVKVTGWVKVRCFKGHAQVVARESPYGIYNLNLATYDTSSKFNEKASYGFIELWGLPTRISYQVKQQVLKDLEEEKKK
jgi:argininosuccinate synthase